MKEKLRNKKVVYTIIGIVSVLLVALAVTYAYWLVTKTQTGENEISSACLDISISGEKNDITLSNQFPMSDEDGMKLVPYEFTVTNNCNTSVDYQVALESTGTKSSAIATSSLKVALDNSVSLLSNNAETDTTVSGAYESRVLGYSRLAASGNEGSSATHKLRVWIDADAPISETNKTFISKISVTIGQGIKVPVIKEGSLAYNILANYDETSELDASTGVFGNATTASDAGLYKTQDDLGDSYYYRGNVTNNYVQFGSYAANTIVNDTTYTEVTPIYWRIVRINGDGTIRLVYDGTEKAENGSDHTSRIGSSEYNSNYNNAKYVGYTYDTSDTDTIQVDSTIKDVVDAWYDMHLEVNYGDKIADSIFCNDRSVGRYAFYDEYDEPTTNPNEAVYTIVFFGADQRLKTDKAPSLKCTNKSDRYTVSDITNGNGLLSNPVGLITADEVAFAGGKYNSSNSNYYLYNGDNYWTSTPSTWASDVGIANAYYANNGGDISMYRVDGFNIINGVRPVINLKADVEFTGNGSFETPYKIVTE